MTKPIWTVTGRAWDSETRDHTKLVSMDFERRCDATGFMNVNRDYIAGMVLDRNDDARKADDAQLRRMVEWDKNFLN